MLLGDQMGLMCGIYGYSITRPTVLGERRIEPRTNELQQAKSWVRDLESDQLTAIISGPTISVRQN